MSTHISHFSEFLHHFVLAKLATSSLRVKGSLWVIQHSFYGTLYSILVYTALIGTPLRFLLKDFGILFIVAFSATSGYHLDWPVVSGKETGVPSQNHHLISSHC